MPRVQPKDISKSDKNELLSELWNMVHVLGSKEEIEGFFRDLLSETEAIMLARRMRIARLLLEGKSYDDIIESMKTGYATIAGVNKWLQEGSEAYSKLIPKIADEIRVDPRELRLIEKEERGGFATLKKKYPLHFLLFNIWDSYHKPRSTGKSGKYH